MPTFEKILTAQPYPLVFVTISGSHLYGFDSVDSDVDLRGIHVLPAAEVAGLDTGPETLQGMTFHDGVEIDLVTHDLLKFCRLLLRPTAMLPSNCSRRWSSRHRRPIESSSRWRRSA